MATRLAAEWISSGQLDNIALTENIQFLATSPAEEGMFMRIGANGLISLYRAENQDVEWVDTDVTEFGLTVADQEVLAIVIDQEIIGNTNGSFGISGIVSNSRNQVQTLDITVKDDGVAVGVGHIELAANEVSKPFLFSGITTDTIASGSVITVEFGGSDNLTLNGTSSATRLKITAAQSAPVAMSVGVLDSFDWNLLPTSEPVESGKLWIKSNGSLRVS